MTFFVFLARRNIAFFLKAFLPFRQAGPPLIRGEMKFHVQFAIERRWRTTPPLPPRERARADGEKRIDPESIDEKTRLSNGGASPRETRRRLGVSIKWKKGETAIVSRGKCEWKCVC